MANKLNILVAPLDWGLGHATRCIPIITELQTNDCHIIMAASGPQAQLLQEAFPHLPLLHLQGYGVQYSRKNVLLKILAQVPAIIRSVRKEHQWLQPIIKEHRIDVVISDNRYGLWSGNCKCILITHQLAPALPKRMHWASSLLRRLIYSQVEHFTACWVPDVSDQSSSLSGTMGHPTILPKVPVHYPGWLTRFEQNSKNDAKQEYKLLAILSGPEPQRTMLEKLLLEQLPDLQQPVLVVRGLPGETSIPHLPAHVTIVNHLAALDLQTAMLQSEYVITRGGYSTLMDAFTLQKKCIFIPTPGQTEQEYLCERLQQQHAALCFVQSSFQIQHALQMAETFPFLIPTAPNPPMLSGFIKNWLNSF